MPKGNGAVAARRGNSSAYGNAKSPVAISIATGLYI
jgi:hypothetical protein